MISKLERWVLSGQANKLMRLLFVLTAIGVATNLLVQALLAPQNLLYASALFVAFLFLSVLFRKVIFR